MASEPTVLTGELVTLRDFTTADGELFSELADDHAMFEFMKFTIEPLTSAQTVHYLLHERELLNPRLTFNLAALANETFVGWAALGGVTREGEAEFGWYFRSDAWGRGYATDATSLLLRLGFEGLGLQRLIATADPDNGASIRVLEKSGLNNEGLADPVKTWRGIRPRLLFAIGHEQWRETSR